MTNRLIIAGAGGFGRGVHAWVRLSPKWRAKHGITETVFLDDHEPQVPVGAPIIGTIAAYEPRPTDVVLVAVGSPRIRRRVANDLAQRGARFATFVADSSSLGDRVQLGEGTVICPGVLISSDVTISKHAHINMGCTVGHDAHVGEFVTMSPACNLGGGVEVAESAFLGAGVTVLPRMKIGKRTLLGAGAVVIEEIPGGVKAVGNPARQIGPVD